MVGFDQQTPVNAGRTGALGDARAAVDALVRIDEHLDAGAALPLHKDYGYTHDWVTLLVKKLTDLAITATKTS